MNIVIIGGGGHAGSVIAAMRSCGMNPVEFIIDHHFPEESVRHGCRIKQHPPENMDDFLCHIALGDGKIREQWAAKPYKWLNVFHSTAMTESAVGIGQFYGAHSYVGPICQVGNFCIINTGAILEHDSELGSFSHLCPGVVTGGRVKIGHHTTIGLGAMIRDGIRIGNNCIIGMGSVVVEDVPDNTVAFGNPCTFKRFNT